MSMETPHFVVTPHEGQVAVVAEQHQLEPAVLFEMLGGTILRSYNINNPKEENMYLMPSDAGDNTRDVLSELPATEVHARMTGAIKDFEAMCDHLRDVSDRQLQTLADYAIQRHRGTQLYESGYDL